MRREAAIVCIIHIIDIDICICKYGTMALTLDQVDVLVVGSVTEHQLGHTRDVPLVRRTHQLRVPQTPARNHRK